MGWGGDVFVRRRPLRGGGGGGGGGGEAVGLLLFNRDMAGHTLCHLFSSSV